MAELAEFILVAFILILGVTVIILAVTMQD